MKDIKDICLIVQARLSSQRIPQKMIKPFAETTLMDICIKKLKNSRIMPKENIYMAVYEPELREICEKHEINIFHRSKHSALSEGTPMTDMFEWWDKLPYKYIIMVNACCPFLEIKTIDNFVEAYMDNDSRGMFGVIAKKNYFWNKEGDSLLPLKEAVMNTKTADVVYEAAHCLYAGSMSDIGKGIWMGNFTKDDPKLFTVPEEETLDIDYQWQFEMCETLYKQTQSNSEEII